ncbi:hypothetical protein [Methanobrevibacter sp.]|uniref:hypothetical protein n=1 Tax=Methanobrevibacter sp. TaxID=66852 RepID=UPI003870B8D1
MNSKILGILLALLAITMVISTASAVDLVKGIDNDNFGIDVIPGANFDESVNIALGDMDLAIFENSGNNSGDVDSIIYFKDSSANKNEIDGFIEDLERDGKKVEETDKYVVLENNQNFVDFDFANDLDSFFNMVDDFFSSDKDLNLSADGNSVSLSDKGLEVSDADGENVSITTEGVSVSSGNSSGNETVNVSNDVDVNSEIENSDYSIYLKNQDNDKVIVISGNNLELLKVMAETVSFN